MTTVADIDGLAASDRVCQMLDDHRRLIHAAAEQLAAADQARTDRLRRLAEVCARVYHDPDVAPDERPSHREIADAISQIEGVEYTRGRVQQWVAEFGPPR